MKYEVRAISGDSIETLVVDAISEDDAARVVGERQLTPLAIRPCTRAAGLFTARSARFDLVLFSIELMELLDAGLGVAEAVDALSAGQRDGESEHALTRKDQTH